MDGKKDKCLGTSRDRPDAWEAHSAREGNKTETDVLWTCDANQWSRKRNDAGVWRRKEGKRTTKNEVDG